MFWYLWTYSDCGEKCPYFSLDYSSLFLKKEKENFNISADIIQTKDKDHYVHSYIQVCYHYLWRPVSSMTLQRRIDTTCLWPRWDWKWGSFLVLLPCLWRPQGNTSLKCHEYMLMLISFGRMNMKNLTCVLGKEPF